jgi:hypothetical protein
VTAIQITPTRSWVAEQEAQEDEVQEAAVTESRSLAVEAGERRVYHEG